MMETQNEWILFDYQNNVDYHENIFWLVPPLQKEVTVRQLELYFGPIKKKNRLKMWSI